MTQPPLAFTGSDLDRAAHLRSTIAMETAQGARVLAFWKGKALMRQTDTTTALEWLEPTHPLLAKRSAEPIFMGLDAKQMPHFAVDVDQWIDPASDDAHLTQFLDASQNIPEGMADGVGFADLRMTMGRLSPADAGNAAMARGMFEWHRSHGFCARCGDKSNVAKGGWSRKCEACGASHFPRTDPVVIMLITNGNDVLLGRSPGWPDGMYSLLAGFMEPGETVEAAVRREVMEETQVNVGAVHYLASQPWPFPSSLMIGCAGIATSRAITLDPIELEDAIWVSRERVAETLSGNDPSLMPARKGAIARDLIEMWLKDTA